MSEPDVEPNDYLVSHLDWIAAALAHWHQARRLHALRSRPGPRSGPVRRPARHRRILPPWHRIPRHRRP
jgi:hypothetical protein